MAVFLLYDSVLSNLDVDSFPALDMYLNMIPGNTKTCLGNISYDQLSKESTDKKRMDGRVLAFDARKKINEVIENTENRIQICAMEQSSCTQKFTLSEPSENGWYEYIKHDSSACKDNFAEEITVSGNLAYVKTFCSDTYNLEDHCWQYFKQKTINLKDRYYNRGYHCVFLKPVEAFGWRDDACKKNSCLYYTSLIVASSEDKHCNVTSASSTLKILQAVLWTGCQLTKCNQPKNYAQECGRSSQLLNKPFWHNEDGDIIFDANSDPMEIPIFLSNADVFIYVIVCVESSTNCFEKTTLTFDSKRFVALDLTYIGCFQAKWHLKNSGQDKDKLYFDGVARNSGCKATIKLVGRELIKCRLLWQPVFTIDATLMVAGKYSYLVEHQTGNVRNYQKTVETSKSESSVDKNIAGASTTVGYKGVTGTPLVFQKSLEISGTAEWAGEWAKLQENRHTSSLIESWSTASMSTYTSELVVNGGAVHHIVQLVVDCSVVTWKSEIYRVFSNNDPLNKTFDEENSSEAMFNPQYLSEELDESDTSGLLQYQLVYCYVCIYQRYVSALNEPQYEKHSPARKLFTKHILRHFVGIKHL
uniref:Uncharacterized protein n=1 Tax=Ditylenchus dipsaci TaxID=166011 RepID=A0A915DU79_9BILA